MPHVGRGDGGKEKGREGTQSDKRVFMNIRLGLGFNNIARIDPKHRDRE